MTLRLLIAAGAGASSLVCLPGSRWSHTGGDGGRTPARPPGPALPAHRPADRGPRARYDGRAARLPAGHVRDPVAALRRQRLPRREPPARLPAGQGLARARPAGPAVSGAAASGRGHGAAPARLAPDAGGVPGGGGPALLPPRRRGPAARGRR